LFFNTPVLVVK